MLASRPSQPWGEWFPSHCGQCQVWPPAPLHTHQRRQGSSLDRWADGSVCRCEVQPAAVYAIFARSKQSYFPKWLSQQVDVKVTVADTVWTVSIHRSAAFSGVPQAWGDSVSVVSAAPKFTYQYICLHGLQETRMSPLQSVITRPRFKTRPRGFKSEKTICSRSFL